MVSAPTIVDGTKVFQKFVRCALVIIDLHQGLVAFTLAKQLVIVLS